MVTELMRIAPLLASFVLGAVLTFTLAVRRRSASYGLAAMGFLMLLAVQFTLPFTSAFRVSLFVRGIAFERASTLVGVANVTLNLISAVGVLCIVGAIAMAQRTGKAP
jgi:hypothetical protein